MKKLLLISVCLIWNVISLKLMAQDVVEWDVFRHERFNKELNTHYDSLKLVLRHRWTVGVSSGYLWMPGYLKAEDDTYTGVDMRDKGVFWKVSAEYFVTQKSRIGIEFGYQKTPKGFETVSGEQIRVRGSGGVNLPILIYLKRQVMPLKLFRSEHEQLFGEAMNSGHRSEPHLFLIAGVGVTSTNLLRVHGTTSSLRKSAYQQVPFTSEFGIGIFQRTGKRVAMELMTKYQLSSNYKPTIGSVRSYSGFSVSMRLSFIGNGKFNQVKKNLTEAYLRRPT